MIKLNKQKFNNACVIFQIDFMATQNKHNENEFSSNIENSTKNEIYSTIQPKHYLKTKIENNEIEYTPFL